MKESAQAALSWSDRAPRSFGSRPTSSSADIHLRAAGAIPKDGPSAGVTMATALTSPDRASGPSNLAMTVRSRCAARCCRSGAWREGPPPGRDRDRDPAAPEREGPVDWRSPGGAIRCVSLRGLMTRRCPRARRPVRRPRGPARERLIDHRPPPPDQTAARPCPNSGRIRSSAAGSSSGPSAFADPPTFALPGLRATAAPARCARATSARPRPRCWSTVTSRPDDTWRVRVVPVVPAPGRGDPSAAATASTT